MPFRLAAASEKLDNNGPLVGQRQAGVDVPLGAVEIGLLLDSAGLAAGADVFGTDLGGGAVAVWVFGTEFGAVALGWLAATRDRCVVVAPLSFSF